MPIKTEQTIDRHLGGPHRVFDSEDDIVGDFAILTDEGEIGGSDRPDVRTITLDPRHELTGDERHHARDAVRGRQNPVPVSVEAEVAQQFDENLLSGTLGHLLAHEVARLIDEQAIPQKTCTFRGCP